MTDPKAKHERRRQETERNLQRTTDELEERIEDLEEDLEEAKEAQAARREEADLTGPAGKWENRARDDEGPFGVLGGPMGEGGGTRDQEDEPDER